jgi:alkyl hydroperoxide reductase subunit F
MMALEANIQEQLKQYLALVENPVKIVAYTDDTTKSLEMMELLREIDSLSDKITLVVDEDYGQRTPSFSVGEGERMSFAGIPMGHEFTSLILAILWAGGRALKIDQDKQDQIRALEGRFDFVTYISLSCHNCPDVVQALNMMAVLNPNITHTMVDGGVFTDEVKSLNIMAVPSIYLNGEFFASGRQELDQLLAKIDTGAGARAAEKLKDVAPYDVLIVGGGPAGASAAVYAARKGLRTGIVAEQFGGQVTNTLDIENLIGTKKTDGPKLVRALEEHVKEYEVDVHTLQRARKLTKSDLVEVELDNGAVLRGKTVIISTGASWRKLGVPGELEYANKGVAYCPHCDGPLFKGKRVAVIGGGNSGVEAAIDLAGIVGHVTVLQRGPKLTADAVLVKKLESLTNVTILTDAVTDEIVGTDKVTGIRYNDNQTVGVEGVFIQIGLVPNTDWLKDTVELTAWGEIVVDHHNSTNIPGVFAAGDCTNIPYKQIIIAMGEGSNASLSAFDYLIRN